MARSRPRRRARGQWLWLPRVTRKEKTNSYVQRFSEAHIPNRLQRVGPHLPRVPSVQAIHRQKTRTLVSLGSVNFARRSTSPILTRIGIRDKFWRAYCRMAAPRPSYRRILPQSCPKPMGRRVPKKKEARKPAGINDLVRDIAASIECARRKSNPQPSDP